jgi:peptide/nickel transport system ATP-binding protein
MALLEIEELRAQFTTRYGPRNVLDGVSLSIDPGEVLAVVGESGSGKTVIALSILGLTSDPSGRIVGGSIRFAGRELIGIPAAEMRAIRGADISLVLPDSLSALNPLLTVNEQIGETIVEHKGGSPRTTLLRAVELLELAQVPDTPRCLHAYPHQLPAEVRARVMIAIGLACEPKLLIADEPTAALDAMAQARMLELLREISDRTRVAILLLTRDPRIAVQVADRIVVMYAGRKVEEAAAGELLRNPLHSYTRGLIATLPSMADDARERALLREIPGGAAPLDVPPAGCAFAPRCADAISRCAREKPGLEQVDASTVACFVASTRRPSAMGAAR